jgi:hypothetical protein
VTATHLLRLPQREPKRKRGASGGRSIVSSGRKEPLRDASARLGCQATIESIMDGRLEILEAHQGNGARPVMDVPEKRYCARQRLAAAYSIAASLGL